MRRHGAAFILLLQFHTAMSRTCFSTKTAARLSCGKKCRADRAKRHCQACVCAACAFCNSHNSSSGEGQIATKRRRPRISSPKGGAAAINQTSTSADVLRRIGYVPGPQLPLEFGGPSSDFTAEGAHLDQAPMLLRAEKSAQPRSEGA